MALKFQNEFTGAVSCKTEVKGPRPCRYPNELASCFMVLCQVSTPFFLAGKNEGNRNGPLRSKRKRCGERDDSSIR